MARLSQISVSQAKVKDGRWVEYDMGIRLKIGSQMSIGYRNARDKVMKPHMKRVRRGASTEEILRLQVPAVAQHILVGWENIEDDSGNPIPYTAEAAAEILSDPRYRDIYDFVLQESSDLDSYREEISEESKGN